MTAEVYLVNSVNRGYSVVSEIDEEVFSLDFSQEDIAENALVLAKNLVDFNDSIIDIGVADNAAVIRYTDDNGKEKIFREYFDDYRQAEYVADYLNDVYSAVRYITGIYAEKLG